MIASRLNKLTPLHWRLTSYLLVQGHCPPEDIHHLVWTDKTGVTKGHIVHGDVRLQRKGRVRSCVSHCLQVMFWRLTSSRIPADDKCQTLHQAAWSRDSVSLRMLQVFSSCVLLFWVLIYSSIVYLPTAFVRQVSIKSYSLKWTFGRLRAIVSSARQ